MDPLIPAIVVSFILNSTNAIYCTRPMPWTEASAMASKVDFMAWKRDYPALTPPNPIAQDHPNYATAITGRTFTDPATNAHVTVLPCIPFPRGSGLD